MLPLIYFKITYIFINLNLTHPFFVQSLIYSDLLLKDSMEEGISSNSGISCAYVGILYPWSFKLRIIPFCCSNAAFGSRGCKAILITLGFCLIKRLEHISSPLIFTIFYSGYPVESQFNTFGTFIFLNALWESNTNYSCVSAKLNPNFSNTSIELLFSIQAGGINTLGYIPISWNISSPARISSAVALVIVWKSSNLPFFSHDKDHVKLSRILCKVWFYLQIQRILEDLAFR